MNSPGMIDSNRYAQAWKNAEQHGFPSVLFEVAGAAGHSGPSTTEYSAHRYINFVDADGDTLRSVKKIHDLPTPFLVLDLEVFEANLDSMSRFTRESGIALRPHAKTHKCVNIARLQLEKGAIGICVATMAEAEVMVRGGVRGLLITGEMVGEPKVSRLIKVVSEAPDTMVVVDDVRNVEELQSAASSAGIHITVLIDLDIGQNRTGTQPGESAAQL